MLSANSFRKWVQFLPLPLASPMTLRKLHYTLTFLVACLLRWLFGALWALCVQLKKATLHVECSEASGPQFPLRVSLPTACNSSFCLKSPCQFICTIFLTLQAQANRFCLALPGLCIFLTLILCSLALTPDLSCPVVRKIFFVPVGCYIYPYLQN